MWESLRGAPIEVIRRVRVRFRSGVALSLAFRALEIALLAPLFAIVLRVCLSRWGRASVGNFEIAQFLLSPVGLAALLGFVAILVGTYYLELAGIIRLLADDRLPWWKAFQGSTRMFPRLIFLGLRQFATYFALAIPFAALIALAYWLLWSGKDLNGLLVLKPPEFWWGAGFAAGLAVVYALLALRQFVRWIYAVPILCFEPKVSVAAALRMSSERSRGTARRCVSGLVTWGVALLILTALVAGIVDFASQRVLRSSGSSFGVVIFLVGMVLVLNAAVAATLRVVASMTLAGVVLWLYQQVAPVQAGPAESPGQSEPRLLTPGWTRVAALLAFAVLSLLASYQAIRQLQLKDGLEITAHRAGAAHAPENTLAALKQAILDRADWAEVDVQLTADQALVIMHDVDLARVGGGNRRVDQATLEEIRALDVGTPIGKQFAGERIPTLGELLAAAGDQIRLNIELKPHSALDGQALTRRVIEELRRTGMIDRCRLCSQSYESLQLARQLEPRLPIGYITAVSIGDATDLDVNFLMLKSSLVNRAFVDRAHLRNISVHAWTVNDAAQVAPLLDAGVDNLITDDVPLMHARLDEIRSLETVERLLLRAHHAIAR